MRVDAFDFDLPEDRIALRPAEPRESARLLHVRPGREPYFADRRVGDLPDLLRPGDVLVLNDTRVIPARLAGVRTGRGATEPKIEVTLHKRLEATRWRAFARPARKLDVGDRLRFGADDVPLTSRVIGKGDGGEVVLEFDCSAAAFDERLDRIGTMPLPPYIAARRSADDRDRADYQTVYARTPGAVAAPTAGLHFTEPLLRRLADRGIARETVTLHVGAGTFLPVKAETTEAHRMHAEWGSIDAGVAARLTAARRDGRRIVAGGTTALRLLESAATEDGEIHPFSADTAIFITPGYRFRAVDALITNFHLPRSTLFMLVSAFSGPGTMQAAYAHAIASGYRFYSYGDASLLERAGG